MNKDVWIARDQDGRLSLFFHGKPEKREGEVGQGYWDNDSWDGIVITDDNNEFKNISWGDAEATKVKITIEKI